jgi:aspartyl protease family protein
VAGIVLPQAMPFVLLGNSFLTRFQMQRNNDQMTLDRRY